MLRGCTRPAVGGQWAASGHRRLGLCWDAGDALASLYTGLAPFSRSVCPNARYSSFLCILHINSMYLDTPTYVARPPGRTDLHPGLHATLPDAPKPRADQKKKTTLISLHPRELSFSALIPIACLSSTVLFHHPFFFFFPSHPILWRHSFSASLFAVFP